MYPDLNLPRFLQLSWRIREVIGLSQTRGSQHQGRRGYLGFWRLEMESDKDAGSHSALCILPTTVSWDRVYTCSYLSLWDSMRTTDIRLWGRWSRQVGGEGHCTISSPWDPNSLTRPSSFGLQTSPEGAPTYKLWTLSWLRQL